MRLIDADALIDGINKQIDAEIKRGVNAIADRDIETKTRAEQAVATFCEASLTAKKMPTIDAVSVIRCKDCKFYHMTEDDQFCGQGSVVAFDEHYCSIAERKTMK